MTTTFSSRGRSSGPRARSGARPEERSGGPRRFGGRRKVCAFCADKQAVIDYKAVGRLRRYLSERARMESARKTGTCARHQRQLREALKRARHLAFLPFASEHRRVTGPVAPPPAEQRVEPRPDPSATQAGVAGQPEPETAAAEEETAETKAEAVPEPEAAEEEMAETKAETVPEPAAAEEETAETKAETVREPEAAEEETAETKAEAVPEPEAAEEETGQPEPEAAAAEEETAETKAEADPAPEAEVDGEEAEEEKPES